MQVTESYLSTFLNSNLNANSTALANDESELSSGLQLTKPSDNPAGTSQVLSLNDSLANITQYQTDATSATNTLSYTESQLQSVQNLLTQAQSIAVAAANGGTQNTDTEAANATQISSIISQITDLANTQLNGNYIFSGTATSTQPYTPGDSTYTYNGNTGTMTATLGTNTQMAVNTPGNQIFAPIFSALTALQTDITSGNATNISNTDIGNLQAANSNVTQIQAGIGTNVDEISSITSRLGTASDDLQNQLSSIQDVNIATVYTQMQNDQNVYQASLEATAEAFKYSLADYVSLT
jgi:flagellar hook-associated protein 3 FlgL